MRKPIAWLSLHVPILTIFYNPSILPSHDFYHYIHAIRQRKISYFHYVGRGELVYPSRNWKYEILLWRLSWMVLLASCIPQFSTWADLSKAVQSRSYAILVQWWNWLCEGSIKFTFLQHMKLKKMTKGWARRIS